VKQVAVQGVNAVAEVTAALRELDDDPAVEVIVIARGGGSLEDLLPFSNETLVRAVAAARTPIVSAIGHDVDSPLIDLVADHRASTPTDAGKAVVPDVSEQLNGLVAATGRLRRAVTGTVRHEQAVLDGLRTRPVLAQPEVLVDARADDVRANLDRARRCLASRLDRGDDDIRHFRTQVRALSPAATLDRGYAVVQRPDGAVVRSPGDVTVGDRLRVRVAGGDLSADVTGIGPDGRRPAADRVAP
jgi:exodeoxyribonuclease VII large subunit